MTHDQYAKAREALASVRLKATIGAPFGLTSDDKAAIITALAAAGQLVPEGYALRCKHRYEEGGRYNFKCDRGPGNYDLCEVADCPLLRADREPKP